jgi:hypothetical protein
MRDGATGVAGGRDQHGDQAGAIVQMRDQPRQRARAEVFEGECRAVK